MSTLWRIALTWLLALALPVQGYAAQTMLLCGPAHHRSQASEAHAAHGHDHADKASADAGHAGKCSQCAACCNAAALATPAVSVAVVPPDLPEVPTVVAAHDRVLVGGLDRPPRTSRL